MESVTDWCDPVSDPVCVESEKVRIQEESAEMIHPYHKITSAESLKIHPKNIPKDPVHPRIVPWIGDWMERDNHFVSLTQSSALQQRLARQIGCTRRNVHGAHGAKTSAE